MAQGDGKGWHREPRPHSIAAKKGKRDRRLGENPVDRRYLPTVGSGGRSSPAAKMEQDRQLQVMDGKLIHEEHDLKRLNKEYEEMEESGKLDMDEPELVDEIQMTDAHIKILKALKKTIPQYPPRTRAEYKEMLASLSRKLYARSEALYERQQVLEKTDYDADLYERMDHARRSANWQAEYIQGLAKEVDT